MPESRHTPFMPLPADFHGAAFAAVMLSALMHASWNAIVKVGATGFRRWR